MFFFCCVFNVAANVIISFPLSLVCPAGRNPFDILAPIRALRTCIRQQSGTAFPHILYYHWLIPISAVGIFLFLYIFLVALFVIWSSRFPYASVFFLYDVQRFSNFQFKRLCFSNIILIILKRKATSKIKIKTVCFN